MGIQPQETDFECPVCGRYQSNMRKRGWFETKEGKFIMSICDDCADGLNLSGDAEVYWKELTPKRSAKAIASIAEMMLKIAMPEEFY